MPTFKLVIPRLLTAPLSMISRKFLIYGLGVMATHAFALDQALEGLQDPTQPPPEVLNRMPQATEQMAITPTLTAVRSQGKESFAVINQTMLRLGDKLQDNRLIAVTANSATLINAAQQKTVLTLGLVDYRKPISIDSPHQKPAKRKASVKKPVITSTAQSLK